MIHCKICNVHLHRSHFGSSKADADLAEAEFKDKGWICGDGCVKAMSWSTFNVVTDDKERKQTLKSSKLWCRGALTRQEMENFVNVMTP